MRIRDARAEEFGGISRLQLEAHREYKRVLLPEEWDRLQSGLAKVEGWADRHDMIVAETDDGVLAGAVAYFPPGASLVAHFPPEWASIRLLAVRPSHRDRGVGRLLTEECIRRATVDGAPEIGLHTGEHMATARFLYEKIGFKPYRELRPIFGFPYRVYVKTLNADR